jgi:hypothetical protein
VNFLPTTRSLLSLLKDEKVIRLKKQSSSKYLNGVFDNFREIAKQDKEIICFETPDHLEMVVLYNHNYKVNTFIV